MTLETVIPLTPAALATSASVTLSWYVLRARVVTVILLSKTVENITALMFALT
ncbi:hypothetical protein [Marinimicrobium locisalis]|uniref:hypothetical protein n=1 Tax=Marinimicrobium locisalis TaxID=546022 RepID=UPI003221F8EF